MPLLLKRASELQGLLGPSPWDCMGLTPPAAGGGGRPSLGRPRLVASSPVRGGGSLLRAEGAGQAGVSDISLATPSGLWGSCHGWEACRFLSPALWQVGRAAASRPMQPGCSCRKGAPLLPPSVFRAMLHPQDPGPGNALLWVILGGRVVSECLS